MNISIKCHATDTINSFYTLDTIHSKPEVHRPGYRTPIYVLCSAIYNTIETITDLVEIHSVVSDDRNGFLPLTN